MDFAYSATDKNGNMVSGKISATNIEDAMNVLGAKEIDVIKIRQVGFISSALRRINFSSKLNAQDLVSVFINIAELDRAGMSMSEILEVLRDDIAVSSSMKKFCDDIHRIVVAGSTLSDAFIAQKNAVDPMFGNLIKIAENSGDYYVVFQKIIEYIKWSDNIRSTIKHTMIKSSAALVFIIVLMIGVSTAVAPKILSFLTDNNMAIPMYSKAFMAFSRFLIRYWAPFFGTIAIAVFIFLSLIKTSEKIAYAFDKFKTKIPKIGPLIIRIESARFIAFFNVMYASGGRIEVILSRVADIAGNSYVKSRFRAIADLVVNGSLIEDAMKRVEIFPRSVSKMISIGFKSGNVTEIMLNVKYFLDREINDQVDMLVSSVKPFMIAVTGIFVTWMAIAMFGPIYMNIANFSEQQGG